MQALVLDHVSHSFGGVLAVDDLSLSLSKGEVVCLLGPSGCGKTTALRVAAGLEALQQGRVIIANEPVAGAGREIPPEDRSVGLVFQDYALFPHLTVAGNVAFGLRGLSGSEKQARVQEALGRVGMAESAAAYPHMLSGGQQQRVALARALAPQPQVMLLDEPFSNLDARLRQKVRDETLHVLKESGTTTLMVTHDPEEAMFMADRIALMRAGRIVQEGTPAALYYQPVDAFVASFFGEINQLEGVVVTEQVSTPFGPVDAKGFADGAAVAVLIRPEALHLSPPEQSANGSIPVNGGAVEVMASRLMGRTSLIHLRSLDVPEQETHFHARVPGRFLPMENQRLRVELDRSQAFVFLRETD
ncbi:ABC transporter ATP-binding protein [Pelagibius litoralis]|nr:ABC transporter ATP-binding protein [Pelagibius litoralis]